MGKDIKDFIKFKKELQEINIAETSQSRYQAVDLEDGSLIGDEGTISEVIDEVYDALIGIKRTYFPNIEPKEIINNKTWEIYDIKILKVEAPENLEFTLVD